MALRTDVLPGTARSRYSSWARRGPGRVPLPPILHRGDRGPDAAPPQPPGHHPLVPVPEHVCVPHLRPVHRGPAGPGPPPESPIRRHRERILDYLASRNDLQLAIAVGTAAKESLAAWVASHGGQASPGRLHEAQGGVISPRLRMVGVLHPGGATGGALAGIVADFKAALGRIEGWSRDDPSWLGTFITTADPSTDLPTRIH